MILHLLSDLIKTLWGLESRDTNIITMESVYQNKTCLIRFFPQTKKVLPLNQTNLKQKGCRNPSEPLVSDGFLSKILMVNYCKRWKKLRSKIVQKIIF